MGSDRAFLKARQAPIDLESKVGKSQVINPTTVEGSTSAGFYCEVCACLLKDSQSYLDHINGKKRIQLCALLVLIHDFSKMCFSDQRALGYSMRVERANSEQVKDRISMLKDKINQQKNAPKVSAVEDYDARLATQAIEAERLKRQKKEEAAAKKKEREAAEMEEVDPDIAALMGFGGFGSSKK